MILQALNAYYERLAADPESDVAPYGYSRQQIAFVVVVNADGSLHEIQDARVEDGKGKLRNQSLIVLGNSKPTGSGINPCFLWDNTAYALGYKAKDEKPERTRKAFEAFRKRHLDAEAEVDDPEFGAVCRFLESWSPDGAESHPTLTDAPTGFGVFKLRGATHFVHEQASVKAWWEAMATDSASTEEASESQCLVTGLVGPIARLHEPKIKGVWGGQPAGALLCSVDTAFTAATSYGKSQGGNFPVGETPAFQYCTALNRLLDRANNRRLSVGDTSVVFWTAKPSPAEAWIAELFNPSTKAEDETTLSKVRPLLDAIARGSFPPEFDDPNSPFYVLGLAPNAARVSVRFWRECTLGDFLDKLRQHYADLEIVRGPNDFPYPALWRLLAETARESKDIPDLLEGAMLRAILTGQPYPQMFYAALLRRIQADREVRFVRAAAIKACLNRNSRFGINPLEEELPMALDQERPESAYQLGRLFAELEKTQEDALPGINDTIKDRYFGAASSTPASVFPRLIRMNQHHLGKLERGNRTYHERRIQEIAGRIDGFDSHLSMPNQGLFAIGYYHQRQDIFTKKAAAEAPDTVEAS
ncbi:CRISPR-associated protein (Cas_Csd1) [Pirellulimonas nuda]|uniref:CRISPR-associated protein (Cas_Csd1) n=1 Tax=Pirellulimonas nuda TaxID=2528009 RepID=A0A518DAA4_9BACT|nr:type I-C CRISPR-associated protein Cas8c/Csd1 [Pirellulimonas nuda]QDU88410.1 CRISPR-associated protein (Cas_Csd1) [Pirellulimonas nuda]